jgi:hypothetical protein
LSEKIDAQPDEAEERISKALKAWYTPGGNTEDLLSDFLIVQEEHQVSASPEAPAVDRLATNRVLTAGIDELGRQDSQLAQVLQLRFVEKQKLWAVANAMAVSEQTVSRLQKKAVQQLANLIGGRETASRTKLAQEVEAGLPPATYTRLFGVAEGEVKLLDLLEDSEGPAVIAIIGIGGIGKTALTDRVVRQIIRRFIFHKVLWLRVEYQTLSGQSRQPELTIETVLTGLSNRIWPDQAEGMSAQQRLVRLRQELESRPYLIVIDNLENEADGDYLLNQLRAFARPSRFLLTSRNHLAERAAVFNLWLRELSPADAAEFLHYHAQERGIDSFADVSDENIAAIYEVTGGNPLALKLTIGLLDVLPLAEVLADLTVSHTDPIQGMYRHIYRRSWKSLSDDGRTLLQAMPLVSESGGTPQYLRTVSGLVKENLWPALQELHNRSLVEVRGTIQEKRYGIHRLTNAFLCTEIIHRPEWL